MWVRRPVQCAIPRVNGPSHKQKSRFFLRLTQWWSRLWSCWRLWPTWNGSESNALFSAQSAAVNFLHTWKVAPPPLDTLQALDSRGRCELYSPQRANDNQWVIFYDVEILANEALNVNHVIHKTPCDLFGSICPTTALLKKWTKTQSRLGSRSKTEMTLCAALIKLKCNGFCVKINKFIYNNLFRSWVVYTVF